MASVDDQIYNIVKEFDESISLKPRQLEVLRHLASKDKSQDIIANLPVGYGKSLLYQILPRLLKTLNKCVCPVVIVISPLNVIQLEQVCLLTKKGVRACKLPFKDVDENDHIIEEVLNGDYEVVFAHPEALLNTSSGTRLLGSSTFVEKVVAVVIDECHIVQTWGEEFRTAFKKLKTLPAVFEDQPFLALSGTLTSQQIKKLPSILGLSNPVIVQESPDRKNIFLKKMIKAQSGDVLETYENIFKHECDNLKMNPDNYPVTLLFLPLFYMSQATAYLSYLFGKEDIRTSCYAVLFSNQDKSVIEITVKDLQSETPRIRLILTSSVSGMGFDPPSVTRVIHAKPPRNLSQYLQEIGRAGRRGQNATAILYYNNRDVAKNLPGIEEDIIEYCKNTDRCLRELLLEPYGFQKSEDIIKDQCCSYCVNQVLPDSLNTEIL